MSVCLFPVLIVTLTILVPAGEPQQAVAAQQHKAAAQRHKEMFGGLDAGSNAVGFRTITVTDPSRPAGAPPEAGAAAPDSGPADRARRLVLSVWYPAQAAAATAMTMADYLRASADTAFAAEHRLGFSRQFGVTLTDSEWARYSAIAFSARPGAPAAPGRFPLLVGMSRPPSVVAMSEYLASHGYVVAFVERQAREEIAAEGLVFEALGMAEQVRDMQMGIAAMRAQPFVHPVQLGALGFSGDGLAQLVLAMRHPDVSAVAQLDTGYFGPEGSSSYQEMRAYDPSALRAPMFFAYSETLGRNTDLQMAEIEKMRYAPRYLLYLGEPRMNHWDFATEGMAMATALDRRPDARAGVTRAFVATQQYQRAFFDAFVKRDPAAAARLRQPPSVSGAAMIEMRERPAVVPALSRRELRALLGTDPARALQGARDGLARDPRAAVFEESWLNALGYELLQRNQRERAVEMLTLNVEAHPRSANAYDSLSEALEAAAQPADAIAAVEKGLAALAGDTSMPPAQRQTVEKELRARLARLRPR